MYESVLGIDFGDVSWLFKAVLIRHDCVHRSGFDKDGNQNEINNEAIIKLIQNCTHLVSIIEEDIHVATMSDASIIFNVKLKSSKDGGIF
jgi:hypothetical protein